MTNLSEIICRDLDNEDVLGIVLEDNLNEAKTLESIDFLLEALTNHCQELRIGA